MTFSQIYYALVLRLAYTCMKNLPIRGLPVPPGGLKRGIRGGGGGGGRGPTVGREVELRGYWRWRGER